MPTKSNQKTLAGHKILINFRPQLAKFAMHAALRASPRGINTQILRSPRPKFLTKFLAWRNKCNFYGSY